MNTRFKPRKLTAAMLSLLVPAFAHALESKVYDLKVSYYDSFANSTLADRKQAIEATIAHFAEGVYEASNGTQKLGKITIFTDGGFKDNTDILWLNAQGDDGKNCWFNAHVGGRNIPGRRIQHCDVGGGDPETYSMLRKPRASGFILLHEWGHFFYGLYDEYVGGEVCSPQDVSSPCKDDVGVDPSVMNSTWNAVDSNSDALTDIRWLNFSTDINNNTATNAQFRAYNASAWTTLLRPVEQDPENFRGIRSNYPELAAAAPAPGTLPDFQIDTADGLAAAKDKLVIEWKAGSDSSSASTRAARAADLIDNQGVIKQFVIDTSANLTASALEDIKAAIQETVASSTVGDVLGVMTFDAAPAVVVPLHVLKTDADKTTIIAAIEAIRLAGGAQPAMGDALKQAVNQITQHAASKDLVAAVYLFSNGYSASGSAPLSVLPDYEKQAVSLFAFDSGDDRATATLLHNLAQKTGGAYYQAKGERLWRALAQADQLLSPTVDVTLTTIDSSVSGEQTFPFYVDNSLGSFEITAVSTGAGQALAFSLLDPQGKELSVAANACDAVDNGDSRFCTITQQHPAEGSWSLKVKNTGKPAAFYADISALPKDNDQSIFTSSSFAEGRFVNGLQTVTLTASVGKDFPITQLTSVQAVLQTPDGGSETVTLRDDGVKPDQKAQDGLYSAAINAKLFGEYEAIIFFDNKAGKGKFTNLGVNFAPNQQGRTPAFALTDAQHKFERVDYAQVTVQEPLSDYQRVMNWGEAVVAPQLLAVKDKRSVVIPPYQVRYYPLTDSYLGYNPEDQAIYFYNLKVSGDKVVRVDSLANLLSAAQKDGF